MNQENIDYLKKELKYFGFGDKLNEGLVNSIKEEPLAFQLVHKGEFKSGDEIKNVEFILDFKKSDSTDKYFFNTYKATLQSENPENVRSQTFYTKSNAQITALEAFNLLEGRAVNKDITGTKEDFNAWRQLDFSTKDKYGNFESKQWHENYKYNLEEAVSKFPIKELSNEEHKTKLLKSLEKGNTHQVTFSIDGKDQKMFISANPQFKGINVYDERMKSVYQGNEKKTAQDGETKKDTKEALKNADDEESGPGKKVKKKGMKV